MCHAWSKLVLIEINNQLILCVYVCNRTHQWCNMKTFSNQRAFGQLTTPGITHSFCLLPCQKRRLPPPWNAYLISLMYQERNLFTAQRLTPALMKVNTSFFNIIWIKGGAVARLGVSSNNVLLPPRWCWTFRKSISVYAKVFVSIMYRSDLERSLLIDPDAYLLALQSLVWSLFLLSNPSLIRRRG